MCSRFMAALLVLGALPFSAGAEDWVVTGTEVVEDQIVQLDGELHIESGGSLTLRDVQLTFENASDGENGIRVKTGGALTIESGTVITTSSDDGRMYFVVEAGAPLVMRDSRAQPLRLAKVILQRSGRVHGAPRLLRQSGRGELCVFRLLHGPQAIRWRRGFHCWQRLRNSPGSYLPCDPFRTIRCRDPKKITSRPTSCSLLHWCTAPTTTRSAGTSSIATCTGAILGWPDSCGTEFVENTVDGGIGPYLVEHPCNTRIVDNTFTNHGGIHVTHASYTTITGNRFTGSLQIRPDVFLAYASHNLVADNVIAETRAHPASLYLYHATESVIVNNRIEAAADAAPHQGGGVMIWGASTSNLIAGNEITASWQAIGLYYDSNDNTISGNVVRSRAERPIVVDLCANNLISNNSFEEFAQPPFDDTGDNSWNDGAVGNFWAGYEGDGSTPYAILPAGEDSLR